jgi:hypothetical protein
MVVIHAISEHDLVSLREPVRGWPEGSTGTVVSDYGDAVLVEFSDSRGKTLDLVQVPVSKLEPVEP